MWLRIANGLLLAALLVLLTGLAGFLIGSAPAGWAEITDGARWYLGKLWQLWPALLPLLGAGTVLWLGWLMLALRNRAQFRADAAARAAAPQPQSWDSRLARARRRLDEGLRGESENALPALLGALVNLEAVELYVEPGGMLATAGVLLEDKRQEPLTSLTPAQYESVLSQAELISGVREGEEGELDLRSRSGVDRFAVTRAESSHGPVLRFRTVVPGAQRRSKRRRPSTVLGLDITPRGHRSSAELARAGFPAGPDDTTDSGSGLLTGLDPAAETEIAPVVAALERRPVRGLEAGLRFGTSLLLLCLLAIMFIPAQVSAMRRLLSGQVTAPWREVDVLVWSRPSGAGVRIDGEPHGTTPLRTREPCGGRPLQVIVEKAGHSVWQWTGICPKQGELRLDAELQPVH